MRTFTSVFAAIAALAGSAEARTINFSDFLALGGGAVRGATIEVIEPEPLEEVSRADLRDAGLLKCAGLRDGCAFSALPMRFEGDTTLAITLEEGFSLANLSFNDHFAGESRDASRTVVINGTAYQLGELSKLTLTGQTVLINLDALAAQQLSLRSFEVNEFTTPLPAAGLLMLAGLGGIALAKRRAKSV
ncbi:MAG: VPLPA-CTERM sorting domain-containing protein [Parvularculaceae bacterium]|nr:VPLPA-CTERM sorting domain-containing protein [Parvularculaceae bacterium]